MTTNLSHKLAAARRDAMIAEAKAAPEPLPLTTLAERHGFSPNMARAYLARVLAPFLLPREMKKQRMVSMHRAGMDCAAIAKEMGLASPAYAYARLRALGENPVRPRGAGAYYQCGTRKMSRDVPRMVKMLGDLKRGMDTATMCSKYGICRERVSQVRAYGVAAGLLN